MSSEETLKYFDKEVSKQRRTIGNYESALRSQHASGGLILFGGLVLIAIVILAVIGGYLASQERMSDAAGRPDFRHVQTEYIINAHGDTTAIKEVVTSTYMRNKKKSVKKILPMNFFSH